MDPTGLLGLVLAIAVYPGGATLVALTWVAHRAGARPGPGRTGWSRAAVLAAIAAGVAAAMVPLPGSPAGALPPGTGPEANLDAILLLLALGAGALPGGIWPGRGVLAGGLAAAATIAIAAPAGSHSLGVITALPGATFALARGAAGMSLVGVGLLLGRGRRRAQEEGGRAALVVACNLTGVHLLVGSSLGAVPGVVAATVTLAAAIGGGALCLRIGRGLPGGVSEAATALSAGVALVAALAAAR